jgi:hypothetical protein
MLGMKVVLKAVARLELDHAQRSGSASERRRSSDVVGV